jgi:predicted lipid-binding transport protein (Tim44 family)
MENFPFGDIVILALIAGFIALRLRATLGKSSGIDPHEILRRREKETAIRVPAREIKPQPVSAAAEAASASYVSDEAKPGVDAVKTADKSFSVAAFLAGARTAFEWVFEAFSKGDKERLKPLMADSVLQLFGQEIDRQRVNPALKPEATLVSIDSADIIEAQYAANLARITVRFASEQIHVTRDASGAIVQGNPSRVEKVHDTWVFERDVTSRSPNWKIVDV